MGGGTGSIEREPRKNWSEAISSLKTELNVPMEWGEITPLHPAFKSAEKAAKRWRRSQKVKTIIEFAKKPLSSDKINSLRRFPPIS